MSSPTQKTLALLRMQGYNPWIVERFNSFSGRRTDLFHIIDILVLLPDGILGVQSAGMDFSGHKKKLMEDERENTKHWLRTTTNELMLIGWRKVKYKRGGKMMIFKPRIAFITLEDKQLIFEEVEYLWVRTRKTKKTKAERN